MSPRCVCASISVATALAVTLPAGPPALADPLPPPDAAPPPPAVVVRTNPPELIWPAYKYPDLSASRSAWGRALATGGGQSFIVNPANGPGKVVDEQYRTVIARARAAGIGLLGYVDTDYGTRQDAQVKADITRWQAFYGLRSVFFDQAASRTGEAGALLAYYRRLHALVHANGGAVVLNPGVVPDRAYADVADSIVTFEGNAASYRDATFPRWTADLPDRMNTHIVYGASAAEQAELVLRAHQLGAGRIYVTDDTGANPYDSLPSYYELERSQLRAMG